MAAIMLMMVFAVGCNKPDEPNNGSEEPNTGDTIIGIRPDVTTERIIEITHCSAKCCGYVYGNGNYDILEKGFCWSTTNNPTTNDFCVVVEGGFGSLICHLTDLESNTTYYVRAFASNENGIGYGEEVIFTTMSNAGHNWPNGKLPGLFSVEDNKQVQFSQGNLQYQASTNMWRFAYNQFDYVGNADNGTVFQDGVKSNNEMVSESYSGWIDVYGWGTSGYNHGATCCQPWSTDHISENYWPYGKPFANLNDYSGKADWGYNAISNGGNQENVWHVLTQSEWNYIFELRQTASSIRFAKALVNGIKGIIILPDDWQMSTYSLNKTNEKTAQFDSNTIDLFSWSTIEAKGAVFLPIEGYRVDELSGLYLIDDSGYYWSSTRHYWNEYARVIAFSNQGVNTEEETVMSLASGCCVRLVCNVE